MKYRSLGQILAITLLFVVSLARATPEISIAPTPAWVDAVGLSNNMTAPEGSVRYHLSNSQISHTNEQHQYYFQLVMEPLNQQGVNQVSELNISFYPAFQQLVIHEITVTRDNRVIDRLEKEDFKLFQSEQELSNKLYSEMWNALYILEDIRPGDKISYAYTLEGNNPIFERGDFGTFYLSWPDTIDRRFVKITSDNKLNYRFNTETVPIKVARKDNIFQYTLDLQQVSPVLQEGEYPHWHDPFNYIQYSGYSSWAEVNDWAMTLYDIDLSLPQELTRQLDQWRAEEGLESAVSKAVAYVQEDIRYFGIEFGINSHQPRTPKETLDKRYGDCKDKAILITAMLSHLGVKAYPALVSSGRGRDIANDIPSPSSFDHVISVIELNGQDYWIDGTASGQGSDIKSKGFFDYELALPVRAGTQALKEVTTIYPANGTLQLDITETFAINAGANTAGLTVESTYSALKAEQMRHFFQSADSEYIKSNYANFMATYYPGIEITSNIHHRDNRDENKLQVSELYEISDFAELNSARKIFSLYGSSIASYITSPQKRIRQSPLALTHPVDIHHKTIAEISGEVLWRDESEDLKIDNPWFTFSRTSAHTGNNISVNYAFKSKADHVRNTDIAEYMEQLDKLDRALQYQFWAKGDNANAQETSKAMKNLVKSLIRK
ncbi:DUF3857 domain-containing transglutaminase family protein [Microbulbifer sp. SSSA002]|uniref:DUF3857 domain-containing transglutaminase family protein n=1 Tax=unclassified Microbulbifer TaxID=2619833 RepID=UPI00403A528E